MALKLKLIFEHKVIKNRFVEQETISWAMPTTSSQKICAISTTRVVNTRNSKVEKHLVMKPDYFNLWISTFCWNVGSIVHSNDQKLGLEIKMIQQKKKKSGTFPILPTIFDPWVAAN